MFYSEAPSQCLTYTFGPKTADGKDEHDVRFSTSAAAAAAAASDYSSDDKATVSTSDVIQEVEDHTGRSSEMCVGHGKQDIIIIFTRRLFTQLYT